MHRDQSQRLHGSTAGTWRLLPVLDRIACVGSCALEFGNVSGRGPFLTDFGKDAQYGQNLFTTLGYPEFEGPAHNNTCGFR